MVKKGGHPTNPGMGYAIFCILLAVINGYIFGLEYIKNEETKRKGILMLTASSISSVLIILFIGLYVYYELFAK